MPNLMDFLVYKISLHWKQSCLPHNFILTIDSYCCSIVFSPSTRNTHEPVNIAQLSLSL